MVSLIRIFTKNNLKILFLLIDNSYSVRDLAEKAKCSPAKVSNTIKLFKNYSLVTLKNEKNRKVIKLNNQNPLLKEILALLFMKRIMDCRTFKELKKEVLGISLYGSIAEGNIDKHSDIDLWILSAKKFSFSEEAELKGNFSRELKREVSIKILTKDLLKKLQKEDQVFFDELYYKSKVLFGEEIGGTYS